MAFPIAKSKPSLRQTRLQKSNPLAKGLVLGLPFAEGSGAEITQDFSGNGNNGTLSGSVTWQPGPFGWCLSIPGNSTSYIRVPNNPLLKTPHGSQGCWFNISGYNPPIWGKLFCYDYRSNGTWNPPYVGGIGLSVHSTTTQIDANITVGGNLYTITSPASYGTGTWHHAVATYDGATAWLYIDGGPVGSASVSGVLDYGTSLDGMIGLENLYQSITEGDSEYYDGLIDGWFLYSRALSASEIALLYADSFRMYRGQSRSRYGNASSSPFVGDEDGLIYSLATWW